MIVDIEWECYACECMNHQKAKKPSYFQAVIADVKCESCESTFKLQIKKVKGEQQAKFGFLTSSIRFSEAGKEAFDERRKNKTASNNASELKETTNAT